MRAKRAVVAALLVGCGPATQSDPEFWTPVSGGGGSGPAPSPAQASATGASSGTSTASASSGGAPVPASALAFRFTTVSVNGEYEPRNVGAVWISDAQGAFVKTLELWAAKRAKHLVKWRAASKNNVVDAVTGATKSKHVAHEALWDGLDIAGQPVQDGAYRVNVEFTESNSSESGEPLGPSMGLDFTVGATPIDVVAPDQVGFTSIQLVFTP